MTIHEAKDKLLEIFYKAKSRTNKILAHEENYELYKLLLEKTAFLDKAPICISLTTRIYCFINDITSENDKRFPHCQYSKCGKILWRNIKNINDGFTVRFCCPQHGQLHPDTKKKLETTNLKKYHVKHTFQSENNRIKSKITMNLRYGCDYAQQNKSIKKKSWNTMLQRYGVKNARESKELSKKIDKKAKERSYELFLNDPEVIPLFSKEYFINLDYEVNELEKNRFLFDWKCKKCGKTFKGPINHSWKTQGINGSIARCLDCYPYRPPTSKEEIELYEFLKSYENNIITNDRTFIAPLEIDILLNSHKLGIEFDGLYWHSEHNSNCNKYYHLNKTKRCEQKGFSLIHIFEDEWENKKDVVKSYLKNKLRIYDNDCLSEQCSIKEVSLEDAVKFQKANDIQNVSNTNNLLNIGLFFKNDLVYLMSFLKRHYNGILKWELISFCSKCGWHIKNAEKSILEYFEKIYHPKRIIATVDRRWDDGNVLKQNGFTLSFISQPDFSYAKIGIKNSREPKSKFPYNKLDSILKKFDPNLSTLQNMQNNGYFRIWDCGSLTFEKNF